MLFAAILARFPLLRVLWIEDSGNCKPRVDLENSVDVLTIFQF
jgi:hypothetical protein